MFYEQKRIYSREVSKRSCKNDMNPESQTLLEVHFIFYSPSVFLTFAVWPQKSALKDFFHAYFLHSQSYLLIKSDGFFVVRPNV